MRLFKIFILLFLIFILSAEPAGAFSGKNDPNQWEDSVFGSDELNLESHTNETFKNLATTVGVSIFGPLNEKYGEKAGQGAIPVIGNLIATMYAHPPASSGEYFADLGKNLGLVKPAYAQGIGFGGLSNLLPLWKASRNAAYLFFILIFLFTGLAIMFRIKIDPKTAVTIQNSIPKLVIALILVTFSYAIAGLLIDFIYVLIYVGVLLIAQTGWLGDMTKIAAEQQKFINLGFGEAFGLIFVGGARATWEAFWQSLRHSTLGTATGTVIGLTLFGIAAFFKPIILIGLPLLVALIAVIILFLLFKLLFRLIMAYITIILLVIFAPLQILMGALPGAKGGGFGSWFTSLLQNILVFPAVSLFLLLGWVLASKGGPTWTPPVLGVGGASLAPFISIGILLLVNRIPDIIKAAFERKPFAYGTAIGEALKPYQALGNLGFAAGRQYGAEQLFGVFDPKTGEFKGWRRGWRGTAGRAAVLSGLIRRPK